MKFLKNIINERYKGRHWKVKSDSDPNKEYDIYLEDDGKYNCNCPAIKECKHIKRIKKKEFIYDKMISTDVKTIWNGMVAIRDKYVKKALKEKRDLEIKHQRERMIIPYGEIKERIHSVSKPVPDKFSDKMHKLIYFWWRPHKETEEEKLKRLSQMGLL